MTAEAILSKWRDRAAQAEANRAHFSFAAQKVDELVAAGFENARMTFAEQDGRTIGARSHGAQPIHEIGGQKFFLYEKQDLIARKRAGIR